MNRLLVLIPIALVLAACGGKTVDPITKSLEIDSDKGMVDQRMVNIAQANLDGTGEPTTLTLSFLAGIKQSTNQGVAPGWINAQITTVEGEFPDCDECITLLEAARI